MAKLFNGKIAFASALQPTGAQPLDDRSVVQSLDELLAVDTFIVNGASAAYNGMIVSVLDEQKSYMLVDKDNITNEESWVAVGSGNGSLAVETYTEAIELATNDNIGQVIYVKTKSSYDADGEGENEAVEYEAAPYIVIGEKSLMKLAASSASGSIEGEVAELTTKIGTVEEDIKNLELLVGNSENGIVKDVANLQSTVENVEERVTSAETRITEVETAVSTKVEQVEGSRLMTNIEGTKLEGIAEGAQVNIIEGVKVNGTALEIGEDKLVNIEIETPKVKGVDGADKMLSLTENGEIKSELSIKYLKANESEDNTPYIALFGKGGTTLISTINATDFVKDGMISSVKLVDTADNKKELEIVWNTDAGKETVNVDVTSLLDYYYAGNGIAFNEETRKFSVDLKEGETFLVVDASGLGIDTTALWGAADTKYDTIGAASEALNDAKAYTDELADKVYTKEQSNETFVKVENFNEFSEDLETKLNNIEAGAEVNVIEKITFNGVEATVEDKTATVKVDADNIELGVVITSENQEVYGPTTKLSSVLQGIQDSVSSAVSGGLTGVVAGNGINVSAVAANKQTISVKLSNDTNNLLSLKEDGLFVAMYYDGDDVENV